MKVFYLWVAKDQESFSNFFYSTELSYSCVLGKVKLGKQNRMMESEYSHFSKYPFLSLNKKQLYLNFILDEYISAWLDFVPI